MRLVNFVELHDAKVRIFGRDEKKDSGASWVTSRFENYAEREVEWVMAEETRSQGLLLRILNGDFIDNYSYRGSYSICWRVDVGSQFATEEK